MRDAATSPVPRPGAQCASSPSRRSNRSTNRNPVVRLEVRGAPDSLRCTEMPYVSTHAVSASSNSTSWFPTRCMVASYLASKPPTIEVLVDRTGERSVLVARVVVVAAAHEVEVHAVDATAVAGATRRISASATSRSSWSMSVIGPAPSRAIVEARDDLASSSGSRSPTDAGKGR